MLVEDLALPVAATDDVGRTGHVGNRAAARRGVIVPAPRPRHSGLDAAAQVTWLDASRRTIWSDLDDRSVASDASSSTPPAAAGRLDVDQPAIA